jgi:hypothetical protein
MLLWPLQEVAYLSALSCYTTSSPLVPVMMVKSHVFVFLACLPYSTRSSPLLSWGMLLYGITRDVYLHTTGGMHFRQLELQNANKTSAAILTETWTAAEIKQLLLILEQVALAIHRHLTSVLPPKSDHNLASPTAGFPTTSAVAPPAAVPQPPPTIPFGDTSGVLGFSSPLNNFDGITKHSPGTDSGYCKGNCDGIVSPN